MVVAVELTIHPPVPLMVALGALAVVLAWGLVVPVLVLGERTGATVAHPAREQEALAKVPLLENLER